MWLSQRDAVGELLERFPKNRLYNGLKSVVVRKSRIPKIDCFAVGEPLACFPKNRLYNGLKPFVVRKSRIPKIDCFAVGEPLARFPKIVYTMG